MEENNNDVIKEPGNTSIGKKNNGKALASFILSLVGILIAGIPCGIAAIITGVLGITKFNAETEKNKWMAIFGIILGAIDIILVITILPKVYKDLGIM